MFGSNISESDKDITTTTLTAGMSTCSYVVYLLCLSIYIAPVGAPGTLVQNSSVKNRSFTVVWGTVPGSCDLNSVSKGFMCSL